MKIDNGGVGANHFDSHAHGDIEVFFNLPKTKNNLDNLCQVIELKIK